MDELFKILSICKGGGYRYCRTDPPHPKRNSLGLYPLHRVLMENKLGRLLLPGEEIHHKDEHKDNDDIDNLEVKTKPDHARHHRPALPLISFVCACGTSFEIKRHAAKQRLSRAKYGRLYCSMKCAGIAGHDKLSSAG
jgi:hypothetical protein